MALQHAVLPHGASTPSLATRHLTPTELRTASSPVSISRAVRSDSPVAYRDGYSAADTRTTLGVVEGLGTEKHNPTTAADALAPQSRGTTRATRAASAPVTVSTPAEVTQTEPKPTLGERFGAWCSAHKGALVAAGYIALIGGAITMLCFPPTLIAGIVILSLALGIPVLIGLMAGCVRCCDEQERFDHEIDRQETWVRGKLDSIPKHSRGDYNSLQLKGWLRQEYHHSAGNAENHNAYVLDSDRRRFRQYI